VDENLLAKREVIVEKQPIAPSSKLEDYGSVGGNDKTILS
jgi:hypothetical protein